MFHNFTVILFLLKFFASFDFPIRVPQVAIPNRKLAVLNATNWVDVLTGEWMVGFCAPWCYDCKHMQLSFKEFAESKYLNQNIKVASVDVTVDPVLCARFLVTELPTIFHVKDGVLRKYAGAMDEEAFISFVEEKKWRSVDPVPRWMSPQSYLTKTLSDFFKLYLQVKDKLVLLLEFVVDSLHLSRMNFQHTLKSPDFLYGEKHDIGEEYEEELSLMDDVCILKT